MDLSVYNVPEIIIPYYCSECDRRFSVRIGTVTEQSKISYQNWAIATYLLATRSKEYPACSCVDILE